MMTLEQALMIVTEQNNNRNYQKLNDRIPSRQKVLRQTEEPNFS
ncbi:hypothetical protein [Microcystis aeruginosa]|jgi:hypothetical protein|nr:hypothetical protein [Microcystis aeruginosa]MDB9505860.1 hypothetical protein [Microcystis aeruginosa CS-338/01]